MRYCCRHALSTYGGEAEAGGLALIVRPEFRGRFEAVMLEVVVPARIAIRRCTGPAQGWDAVSVCLEQPLEGPSPGVPCTSASLIGMSR